MARCRFRTRLIAAARHENRKEDVPAGPAGDRLYRLASTIEAIPTSFPETLKKPTLLGFRKFGPASAHYRMQDVRLHDLRHSFASVGTDEGDSLQVIGRLLGHSKITTTQRYAHLSLDPVRDAAERIGGRIAAKLIPERS